MLTQKEANDFLSHAQSTLQALLNVVETLHAVKCPNVYITTLAPSRIVEIDSGSYNGIAVKQKP